MDIYQEILNALQSEERVVLATIVSTSGSTPASTLSKMLIKNQGTTTVGTIGGGCVESDVLARARQHLNIPVAETLCFELREDEFIQGLICGGTLNILLEPIDRKLIPLFRHIKEICENGRDCVLGTHIDHNGSIVHKTILAEAEGDIISFTDAQKSHWDSFLSQAQNSSLKMIEQIVSSALKHQAITRLPLANGELIFEPIAGSPHLIIFGGGHISKAVCRAAAPCGFRITIVDDRETFCNALRFPEASELIVAEFSEVFDRLRIKPSSYLIIATRGHRYDEDVLERALKTPARYIGMLGSKRKVFTAFSRLKKYGFSVKDLQRVQSPVGIELGAVTPEEIAISIVAQLIRERRGCIHPAQDKAQVLTSFFQDFNVSSTKL